MPHRFGLPPLKTLSLVLGSLALATLAQAQVVGGSCTSGSAGPDLNGNMLVCTSGTWQTANSLNFGRITASVTSGSGGTATASCATGSSLMFWGLITDQRTPTFLTNVGSASCSASGNTLSTTVSGYTGGTTNVTCQGLCVRS